MRPFLAANWRNKSSWTKSPWKLRSSLSAAWRRSSRIRKTSRRLGSIACPETQPRYKNSESKLTRLGWCQCTQHKTKYWIWGELGVFQLLWRCSRAGRQSQAVLAGAAGATVALLLPPRACASRLGTGRIQGGHCGESGGDFIRKWPNVKKF